MARRRVVLLDRDGTIIVERHYLSNPDDVELIPGTAAALRRLCELGLDLVMVSNQAGIGRGYFTQKDFERVQERLAALLAMEGVRLSGVYFCPHAPSDGCRCRKPEPGMVEQAAKDLDFDPREAFMIGDNAGDVGLGRRISAAGTFLVQTGYGKQVIATSGNEADYCVEDVSAAAYIIQDIVLKGGLINR